MTKDEIKSLVVDYAYGCSGGINPNLALAQIQRESSFNPNAVGSSGERGLGQFMPGTWERFGYGSFDNAFDVEYNLSAWCNYMSYLSGLFGGDEHKILVSYNGGEGHVLNPERYGPPSAAAQRYARELIAQAGGWPTDVPIAQTGEQPLQETSPNWLLIGGIALGAIVLLFAFSDN